MELIWRHYKGNKVLHEGTVTAPCRVTAKSKVTRAIKLERLVDSRYRAGWREYANYTITSISDLRGIRYPISAQREFIVFYEPDRENAMISDLTDPKQKDNQLNLF